MPCSLVVKLTEPAWPELQDGSKEVLDADPVAPIQVAVLEMGMAKGKPSVGIREDETPVKGDIN